jgi:hypothetical protein
MLRTGYCLGQLISAIPLGVAWRASLGVFTLLMGFGFPGLTATASAQSPQSEMLRSPFPQRVIQRGNLKITLSEIRIVMRGPMFPRLTRVGENSLIANGDRAEEGGDVRSIRSDDLGQTWRPYEPGIFRGARMNTIRLADGRILSIMYDTKAIAKKPGYRSTTRWLSDDEWKTVRGPLTDGTVYLPPEEFKISNVQWFHGNTIQLPDGSLLSAMQGVDMEGSGIYPFHTFVARSTDEGKTWQFLSRVASLGTIDDPQKKTKQGWPLFGPCEHTLADLGNNRLISVARIVNDDRTSPMAKASDTYRDLSYTIPGSGIHPGNRYPADKYYTPGPRSAPLIISYSVDRGKTWSKSKPMREACGCFPRTAVSSLSGKDIVALSYGGLAYPRWGNCIKFSTDGGITWTDEINYAPFFSTGYTDILSLAPGKFMCVFDCTPPQPWKDHEKHWVGVVDINVEIESEK